MADFSVEQKKIIDTYRFNNGLSAVLSYEAIVSIMEEKGDSETLERLNKAKNSSVFGFGFDSNLSIGDNAVFSATKKEKSNNEYNYQEQQEAANFIKSYVLDSSSEALNTLISYKKSIGSFSPGAIWHGLKNIVNFLTDENQIGTLTWIMNLFRENKQTNNITTLNEMQAFLENQYKIAQSLNTIDTKELGAIEFFYEKEMGIKFDVGKILDFKQKSENYLKVMKYKTKYDALEQGLQKVKEAYDIEKRMKIYPNIPAPEKSFDEIFVETIDEFCEGNEELKAKYIEIASQGCTNMDELRPKFIENLETLKASMQQAYNNILSGKTAEQYQKEYEQAYQDIAGENNTKEITESWIQNQMRGTGAVQMGLVIASTIMLGGSNLVASSATKLAPLVGETATGLIVKTGLTLSGTAINTGIEYANALTSETGLTQERNTQILSGAIHSLPYAFFGAFASGPIGDNLVKILCSKIPTVLPEIISKSLAASAKVAGFTTEISLDTLFEMLISNGDMQAALEGNITGEAEGRLINTLSSFITGGRVHGITQQVMKNIELEDCKIKITVDEKGNKIYQTVINGKESEPMAETDFIKLFYPEEVKVQDDIADPKSMKVYYQNSNNKSPIDNTISSLIKKVESCKEFESYDYGPIALMNIKEDLSKIKFGLEVVNDDIINNCIIKMLNTTNDNYSDINNVIQVSQKLITAHYQLVSDYKSSKIPYNDIDIKKSQNGAMMTINQIKDKIPTEITDYLYNIYLNSYKGSKLSAFAQQLNDKYNVKLILPAKNNFEYEYSELLNKIEIELKNWSFEKNTSSVIIDLNLLKHLGESKTVDGMYIRYTDAIILTPNTNIQTLLRHELVHKYDKYRMTEINNNLPDNVAKLVDKIMPNTKEVINNQEVTKIDLRECKYIDELLNAGIPPWRVRDAYINRSEFLAIAAEGDINRYSQEFKQILIQLGMPETVFGLKPDNSALYNACLFKDNPEIAKNIALSNPLIEIDKTFYNASQKHSPVQIRMCEQLQKQDYDNALFTKFEEIENENLQNELFSVVSSFDTEIKAKILLSLVYINESSVQKLVETYNKIQNTQNQKLIELFLQNPTANIDKLVCFDSDGNVKATIFDIVNSNATIDTINALLKKGTTFTNIEDLLKNNITYYERIGKDVLTLKIDKLSSDQTVKAINDIFLNTFNLKKNDLLPVSDWEIYDSKQFNSKIKNELNRHIKAEDYVHTKALLNTDFGAEKLKHLLSLPVWDNDGLFITTHSRMRILDRIVAEIEGYDLASISDTDLTKCINNIRNSICNNAENLEIIQNERSPKIYMKYTPLNSKSKTYTLAFGLDNKNSIHTIFESPKVKKKYQ